MFQEKSLKVIFSIYWIDSVCYVVSQDPFGNFIGVASGKGEDYDSLPEE